MFITRSCGMCCTERGPHVILEACEWEKSNSPYWKPLGPLCNCRLPDNELHVLSRV
jgi:hypothetical protein